MPEERLQKILAHAGIASRRKAEELILEGKVRVNGQVVTELGTKADIERDHIKVGGKLLHRSEAPVYVLLNKPLNTVTTASDPQGRRTVLDLVKGVKERIYPVGRLDYNSEGLLLLTNDGEVANALTAASSHVIKKYLVKVTGTLTAEEEARFRRGIPISGRRTAPAGLKLVKAAANPWYEVDLQEGRNHQIRLMFKHLGKLVEKIKRTQIGFLTVAGLKPGDYRRLTADEIAKLRRIAERHRAEVRRRAKDVTGNPQTA